MKDNSNIKIHKNLYGYVMCILSFIINPLCAILLCYFLISTEGKENKSYIKLFICLICCYLSIINTTKIPELDLLNYKDLFYQADSCGLVDYIFITGKEPVFSIITYILNKILFSNFSLYVFVLTFLSYQLYLLSIYKYLKKINANVYTILLSIILASFFYQNFQASGHLVRQFLASSVLFYYMVEKFFYNKNYLILPILAIFLHSSTILFIPLILFSGFNIKINLSSLSNKSFIVFLLLVVTLFIAFPIIVNLTANVPFLGYFFNRIDSFGFNDLNSGELNYIGLLFIVVLSIISIYYIYIYKKIKSAGQYHFINIFLALSIFIFCFLSIPIISLRFFFYVYFFMPFIVALLPQKKIFNISRLILGIALFFLFFFEVSISRWTYIPISDLVFNSLFDYI